MTKLSRDTILQRASNLSMRLNSSNQMQIYLDGLSIEAGSQALAVLDAFTRPATFSDALETMRPRVKSAQDWIEIVSTIEGLHDAGVLRDEQKSRVMSSAVYGDGYGLPSNHVAMLNDKTRTAAFIKGIKEIVQPDDVVVDIGTGAGIFAAAAAQAGARHVYAIEASGIAQTAREVMKSNGLSDKVTIYEGWSTQITLPERADVLISEMVGGEPLGGDHLLEVFADAIKRLLKPGARMIPNQLRVFGLPVTIPRDVLKKHTCIAENVQNWKDWYNIDFTALTHAEQSSPSFPFYVRPDQARDWTVLSEPIEIAKVDLTSVRQLQVDSAQTGVINRAGEMNALFIYFEQNFSPNSSQSTHPLKAGEDCFRSEPVWVLPLPMNVDSGDKIKVSYRYGVPGAKSMVEVTRI